MIPRSSRALWLAFAVNGKLATVLDLSKSKLAAPPLGELAPPDVHERPAVPKPDGMFSGLLAFDLFTVFMRLFLYGFAALLVWLSLITGIPDSEDSADFYALLLGATLGMSIMASANHLLMIFVGVEMASLPSYALAGFLKGRRQSSEAALKIRSSARSRGSASAVSR